MLAQRLWTSLVRVLLIASHTALKISVKILALPWLLWCGVVAESVAFALSTPSSIRKTGSGMYCNTGIPIPGRVSAILAAVHLIPAVIIEGQLSITFPISMSQWEMTFLVLIFMALRKNWSAFKARKNTMSMIIRVFGFSIFGVFALV